MVEPRIRFKEFAGDWQVRKLKDFAVKVTDKNTAREYRDVLTDSAQYGVIDQGDFFDKDIANDENVDRYTIVYPNNYMYNPRISKYAPYGPVRRNKLNKTGIASPMYLVFKTNSTVDDSFLDNYFIGDAWHRYVYSHGNTGARADRIAIKDDDFMDMPIPMPKIDEQRKIGSFFNNLDRQIKAQSDKLAHLKKNRRGYLQKMFTNENQDAPEIRFGNFKDKWSVKAMKSILTERNTQRSEDQEYELMSFVSEKGIVPKNKRYDRSALVKTQNKKYKVTLMNDFIYSSNNFAVGSIGINRTGKALISPVYEIFTVNEGYDVDFMDAIKDKKSFIHKMSKLRQGVVYGQWKVQPTEFLKMQIKVPSYGEQQMIGQFFKQLNDEIKIVSDSLDHLKQLKKGYLQKMFI